MQPLQLFALSMPLSLLAGVLSWHGVERWFVHRRRTAAKAALPAAVVAPARSATVRRPVGSYGAISAAAEADDAPAGPAIRIAPPALAAAA